MRSLGSLLAWKLSLHGVPALGRVSVAVAADGASYTPFAAGAHVSLPRVAGHRDGDQTELPGQRAVRAACPRSARAWPQLAGAPPQLSIAAPVAPVARAPAVTVTGRLDRARDAGTPIAGAPLEVQQIGPHGATETTIATLTTDADGAWSYTATPCAEHACCARCTGPRRQPSRTSWCSRWRPS